MRQQHSCLWLVIYDIFRISSRQLHASVCCCTFFKVLSSLQLLGLNTSLSVMSKPMVGIIWLIINVHV